MIPYGMLLTVSKHLIVFRLGGTKAEESMSEHHKRVSLQLTLRGCLHGQLGVET
jgi:hypothetical protein